jgi:hypothetical protein
MGSEVASDAAIMTMNMQSSFTIFAGPRGRGRELTLVAPINSAFAKLPEASKHSVTGIALSAEGSVAISSSRYIGLSALIQPHLKL